MSPGARFLTVEWKVMSVWGEMFFSPSTGTYNMQILSRLLDAMGQESKTLQRTPMVRRICHMWSYLIAPINLFLNTACGHDVHTDLNISFQLTSSYCRLFHSLPIASVGMNGMRFELLQKFDFLLIQSPSESSVTVG